MYHRFWLIQRGKFEESGESLMINNPLIKLDYMGSAEFEFNAIPKAYRRLMYNFDSYTFYGTGICTKEGDELMLFCNRNCKNNIMRELKNFIKKPYTLKEYSELEKIPLEHEERVLVRRSDFWWCIDIREDCGDWMACLKSKQEDFLAAINHDYVHWWMEMPKLVREDEYNKSLRW